MTELGVASVLIRPDTTGFRTALEAELLAATKGVVVPIPVVSSVTASTAASAAATKKIALSTAAASTATNTLAASTARAAATSTAAAEAMQLEGAAAAQDAVKITSNARAHEQLRRGGIATLLSLLGIRGATLAASASFLGGAAAVTILAKSVKESSKEQEAAARVAKILGVALGEDSEKWARTLAQSFGLSATAALKFQGALAQALSVAGFTTPKIAELSQHLVEVGADLAAFANMPVDQSLRALQLGVSGNLRGLRQFGIVLTSAEVKQEALRISGREFAKNLTRQELVQARVNLILKDAANAQGAAAARSGDLAQQSRILESNLANLGASIGGVVTPALVELVDDLNLAFKAGQKLNKLRIHLDPPDPTPWKTFNHILDETGRVILFGPFAVIRSLKKATDDSGLSAELANHKWHDFFDTLRIEGGVLGLLTAGLNQATVAATSLAAQARLIGADLAGLQGQLLDIQFAGGSPAQQRAKLQQQLAKANEGVALADKAGKGQLAARQKRNAIQDQIKALDAQQAADAKAASDAASAAADKTASAAQDARDKQDAAIQSLLGAHEARHSFRLVFIEATKQVKDDIKEALKWRRELQRFLKEKIPLIHDLKLRAEVALEIRTEIRQETVNIKALNKTLAENAKAHKEALKAQRLARAQTLVESIGLDVELDQTTKNVSKEIRDRERLIKALKAEQRLVKRNSVEWKRLRNEIAAEQQAIKELKKQQQAKNNAAKELFFEFLQAQQGFAANLLSNILPGGAFAGTVGGTSPMGFATPFSPGVPRPGGGGSEDPTRGLGAAAGISQAASERGASQSQMSVLIDLTRQMLRVLAGQRRDASHPEARYQRAAGSADMVAL